MTIGIEVRSSGSRAEHFLWRVKSASQLCQSGVHVNAQGSLSVGVLSIWRL